MGVTVLVAPVAVAGARSVYSRPGVDLTSEVNPLAGSLGAGFPTVAAQLPFGMISPGPITTTRVGDDPVNYVGYAYQDPEIRGFALTHFDGAGIHIAGDLPIMPTVGEPTGTPSQFASPYSHGAELARPGYYAVTLLDSGIRAELTATARVGYERFTFPAGRRANLLVDATRNNSGTVPAVVSVATNRRGFSTVIHNPSGAYDLYAEATVSTPFATWGRVGEVTYLSWPTSANARTITLRVAISYTDLRGAETNLAAEGRGDFDAIARKADQLWNAHLHDVTLAGGSATATATFYTELYRSLLMPTTFDDADGRYLGFDHQVHQLAPGQHHYTNLSGWDTYRSQTPLLSLVEPNVGRDVALSLLDDTAQSHGVIPRWVYANDDYGIMGGDSGTVQLAEAVDDGLLSQTQSEDALADAVRQATTLPAVWPREHLDAYLREGFIGNDVSGIGAAETLEYAIDDSAIAAMAGRLRVTRTVAKFRARAGYWRNLLDPSGHFLRPRNRDGAFANPTSIGAASTWSPIFQDGWQEGTGWQYLWSVPQDVTGLADGIGGRAVTVSRLDSFFSAALQSNTAPAVPTAHEYGSFFGVYYVGNQYTPANEPDLWSGFYYDWLGEPWQTAKVVHAEMATYSTRPDGLPGNDDAGEIASWYVLAALGLYQVTPGVDGWELSTPTFAAENLRVGFGRRNFSVTAPGVAAGDQYISGAHLDGRGFDATWIPGSTLRSGGSLRIQTTNATGSSWGTAAAARPPSLTAGLAP
ncbi:MAG TPA: GH92 family glycosyl hydrolase [Mycobacteriales bacterium]|nr:GH92 family glycosyl hydrolase [Mycobacteriales bacterium]